MASSDAVGILFLIPTPLTQDSSQAAPWLAQGERARIADVRHFIVETPKIARGWLARLYPGTAVRSLDIRPLPPAGGSDAGAVRAGRGAAPVDWSPWLAPLLAGHPAGLLSDAGCPGIADPGAPLVAAAHEAGIVVRPLVGPGAIPLALMASGLQGQRFAFHGYLPVAEPARDAAIRALAEQARRADQTQVAIETPYRNQALADALIRQLPGDAVLVVAADLTGPDESIRRRTVAGWRRQPPKLGRVPTTFLFGFVSPAAART